MDFKTRQEKHMVAVWYFVDSYRPMLCAIVGAKVRCQVSNCSKFFSHGNQLCTFISGSSHHSFKTLLFKGNIEMFCWNICNAESNVEIQKNFRKYLLCKWITKSLSCKQRKLANLNEFNILYWEILQESHQMTSGLASFQAWPIRTFRVNTD